MRLASSNLRVLALGLVAGALVVGCGEEKKTVRRDAGTGGSGGSATRDGGAGGTGGTRVDAAAVGGTGGGGTGGTRADAAAPDMARPVDMARPLDVAAPDMARPVDTADAARDAGAPMDAAAPPSAAPWSIKAIGAGATPAEMTLNSPANETQTLLFKSDGTGIGGKADSMNFANVAVKGDAQVLGNIRTVLMADANTRAGVMFRESLDADAAMVFVGPTGDGMTGRVVYRKKKGDDAVVVPMDAMMAPAMALRTGQWLRLARTGNKVVIYAGSRSGVENPDSAPVGMIDLTLANPAGDAYYGLAMTAGVANMTTSVEVANLIVDNLFASAGTKDLRVADIGTTGAVVLYDAATDKLSFTGWGQEWDTVMASYREFLSLAAKPGTGEFSLQVKVDSLENTAPGTKAGIMYRAQVHSSGGADINAFSFSRSGGGLTLTVTPGMGLLLEGRTMGYQDAKWDVKAMAAGVTAPVWLRLDKLAMAIPNDPLGGTQIVVQAYHSKPGADGKPTTWTKLGDAISLGSVGSSAIGLTSVTYDPNNFATAVMSGITWSKPVPPPAGDAGAGTDATAAPDVSIGVDASTPDTSIVPDATIDTPIDDAALPDSGLTDAVTGVDVGTDTGVQTDVTVGTDASTDASGDASVDAPPDDAPASDATTDTSATDATDA